MAKQSGIHQLRGKVGEHSYYRQTGINAGLVRQINQGMSQRVKTDAAYANTRLNNAEFGAAGQVAALLGKLVHPKFRPMILPFSQSIMAKAILDLARDSSESWGRRVVTSSQTEDLAAILTKTSKKSVNDFVGVQLTRDPVGSLTIEVSLSSAQASTLADLGATRLNFVFTQFDVATGKYNSDAGKINAGYIRTRDSHEEHLGTSDSDSAEFSLNISTFVPTSDLFYGHQFVVGVFMPVREVSGNEYILQEHCMFVAYKLPNP